MNLSKSFEFFDPGTCKEWIRIIGCGSVGSTVAELLARFGLSKFALYDFDTVEPKNIVNQMFTNRHIGKLKVDAVEEIIKEINVEAIVKKYPKGWTGQPLDGYVFLAVDNIDTRKEIVKANINNEFIKGMFDFRTGLTDGQHYGADWSEYMSRKAFLDTMNFGHDDVKNELSACNVELCVAPTVRLISTAGVGNFIRFLKENKLSKIITTDSYNLMLETI